MPLHFWPQIAASASAASSVICVPLPRAIVVVIVVIVYVAYCYHVCCVQISVAALASFLSHSPRPGVKLVFSVSVMVQRTATASGICDGILSIGPFICEAHDLVDCLGLGLSQLLPKVLSDETISKSIDSSFGRDVL
jgi:hypothetical protein